MIQNGKPAPDIYITACHKIGLEPSECIALEDSPNGVKASYNAGCKTVMIPDLTQPDDDTKAMIYGLCGSLDEVIEILEREK